MVDVLVVWVHALQSGSFQNSKNSTVRKIFANITQESGVLVALASLGRAISLSKALQRNNLYSLNLMNFKFAKRRLIGALLGFFLRTQ